MNCDVCSSEMKPKRGYILSTTQIVAQSGYWQRAFQLLPLTDEQVEGGLPGFVRQMAGSESDWIICEECMSHLAIDKSGPSKHYQDYVKTGKRPSIPGTGPADLDQAAMVASGAFEAVFGRKPSTIKIEGDEGPITDSIEYSQRVAEAIRSGDKAKFGKLADLRVRCKDCGAVMLAVETRMTSTGMDCPRCGKPWFMIQSK